MPDAAREIILKAIFPQRFRPFDRLRAGDREFDGVPHKYMRHSEWRRPGERPGRDGPLGRLRNAAQRRRFGTSRTWRRPGAALAVADIVGRCPYLEPRKVTNLKQDLTLVGTARWAVSETQRSAGVSELRGIATALRYAGRRGHRSTMSLPRFADSGKFGSGVDPTNFRFMGSRLSFVTCLPPMNRAIGAPVSDPARSCGLTPTRRIGDRCSGA